MDKIRYEELLPHELRAALAEAPIAYVPVGTLEWHGEHLAYGNDTLKAQAILERVAAEVGGVVLPPTYWGVGGIDLPGTLFFPRQLIGSLWLEIMRQLERVGFRAIVVLTGHYGHLETLKEAAAVYSKEGKARVWALAEYEVVQDEGCNGDHAAKWETSMLWALRPDLVDLSRLDPSERPAPTHAILEDGTAGYYDSFMWQGDLLEQHHQGVLGEDPLTAASRELGDSIVARIVEKIAAGAQEMLAKAST